MPEVRPPNRGPWKDWSEFPAGPDKEAIQALWDNDVPPEEKPGAHFVIQIKGTNPISGYRVYVV
jgi:hypothetical protein